MSSEDKVPPEPDLSVPEGALDPALWGQLLEQAFDMSVADVDASIVPEFDEFADVQLADDFFADTLDFDEDYTDDDTLDDSPLDTPLLDDAFDDADDTFDAASSDVDTFAIPYDDPVEGFDDFA